MNDAATPLQLPARRGTAMSSTSILERLDSLVTRERVRNYSWIFLVLGALTWLGTVAAGDFPVSLTKQIFLPDYLAHWTGGRMVLEGNLGVLYDPAVQAQLQRASVPGSAGFSWFVSPPFVAFLYVPLASLSYGASAVWWTVLSLSLLAASVLLTRPLLKGSRRDYGVFVVVFAATPSVLELVGSGQDSAVALIIWTVALRLLMSHHDLAAGSLLALGLFKPQLFVLVPIVLLMQRRYRALAAFTGVALGLLAASIVAVGTDGISAWLGWLTSNLYQHEVQLGQAWKMQSISAFISAFGTPHLISYVVLGVGAVALAARVRSIRADTHQVWALAALTTIVFSPHVVLYDVVLLLPAMAYVYSHLNRPTTRLLAVAVFVSQWTIAIRHAAGEQLSLPWSLVDLPWSALPLLGLWWLVMRGAPVTPSVVWEGDAHPLPSAARMVATTRRVVS